MPLDETLVGARPSDARVDDLREALDALPLNQRAALVLREVAGLSYAEIARHLSLSVSSVQMLIFRARKALREELATPSRRAGALVPGWLANLIPKAERLAALRVGGVAAVAAAAAVAVTGAESAAPPAVGERHLPPREAQATPAAAPAFVSRLAPKHALEQAERSRGTTIDTGPGATAPPAGASAAGAAQPTAPIRVSQPELPKLVVHVPALPLRLPPLAAELPKELEGTLAPQLDGVLAGR